MTPLAPPTSHRLQILEPISNMLTLRNALESLPKSTRDDYLRDLRIAQTWELQANVASTHRHISSAWRRWAFFCNEIRVPTDLAGHPDPIQVR